MLLCGEMQQSGIQKLNGACVVCVSQILNTFLRSLVWCTGACVTVCAGDTDRRKKRESREEGRRDREREGERWRNDACLLCVLRACVCVRERERDSVCVFVCLRTSPSVRNTQA